MPPLVETMAFVGAVPWHTLGNPIPNDKIYDIEHGVKASGLDWEVDVEPCQTVSGKAIKTRLCYRKSDGQHLGEVGPAWTPVQNWDMFKWFQPWLDAKVCALHTAGSLSSGSRVWVLCQVADDPIEIVKGDEVLPFVLLSNGHDGKMAVRCGFTPIRVVCANTLAMAHNSASSKLIRVRHSSKVAENMENIRNVMDLAKRDFLAQADEYKLLAAKGINQADVRKYVKIILDVENVADADLPTKTKNIMGEIFAMIETGRGQKNPLVQGTMWAAYNGVNEYLNYSKGRNASNRMDTLWFGQNATLNEKALKVALQMAG